LKRGEALCIEREARLVEQHSLGLFACSFEYEIGAAAAHALRRLIDQVALPGTRANADRDGSLIAGQVLPRLVPNVLHPTYGCGDSGIQFLEGCS
jgi:hypothetical protein